VFIHCEERKTRRKELRYTVRKRKALLRSGEFAVVVGGGGAEEGDLCWFVGIVGFCWFVGMVGFD